MGNQGELTSRERVRLALEHRETDRPPIDLGGSDCTTITLKPYEKLMEYLHFKGQTRIFSRRFQTVFVDENLQQLLHFDVRPITYRPSRKVTFLNGSNASFRDEWGLEYIFDGLYYNIVNKPLAEASIDDLDQYNWPDPHDKDLFDGIREEARYMHENTQYALLGPGLSCHVFELCWYLRGFETFLMDLILNKDFAHALFRKVLDIRKRMYGNFLEQAGEYLDIIYVADDVAMQSGPIMSPDTYREMVKTYHKEYFSFIKSKTDAKLFYHCCGGIEPLIEDFIEIGVDILNPVQVTAKGMDPVNLKERYGDRVTFWGGIDTQKLLPDGTRDDVREETRRIIDVMAKGGGYVASAVHNIQAETPPENIMALLDTAYGYRRHSS